MGCCVELEKIVGIKLYKLAEIHSTQKEEIHVQQTKKKAIVVQPDTNARAEGCLCNGINSRIDCTQVWGNAHIKKCSKESTS